MFDFEYIFLQLRARSVGDSIDIKYSDPEFICSKDNKECLFSSTINIDEIKLEKVKIEKELVDITDTIKVKLRWPRVDDTAAMGDLTGEGVDQEKLTRDWAECEAYSEEIDTVTGIAKGAATGAIVGGVAGAIGGNGRESTAYGGLYGATRSGLDADRDKQMIFKRCMRGRGYRVLN